MSPDLNPIEKVWKILKDSLNKIDIRDEKDLEKQIIHAWEKIP
jgi:transposase